MRTSGDAPFALARTSTPAFGSTTYQPDRKRSTRVSTLTGLTTLQARFLATIGINHVERAVRSTGRRGATNVVLAVDVNRRRVRLIPAVR